MMAALHFDNLLFLLLIAVAMLFRWLASAANKASKNLDADETEERSTSTPPMERAPEESDTERMRKFLEALGQPPGSRPPPVMRRTPAPEIERKRTVLPHVPPFASPLPPLKTRPPELPKKIRLPGQFTTPPYEEKIFKPSPAEAPVYEVQESSGAPEPPPKIPTTPAAAYAAVTEAKAPTRGREGNLIALLRSPSGLRSAIILREVFGPPRSLQPLDVIGSA
jgi:hypothetical protein